MPLTKDLLHPSLEDKRKYKNCLVQSPNSCFMDVKCSGCYRVKPVFSHTQMVVLCWLFHCPLPAGQKARLREGCFFR
ncbi:hypothetical protein PANDA_020488, partial [Ailuropoda melanoleuca]